MTQTSTDSKSSVPELFQQFEQEWLQAADPHVVVERYLSLHPELAEKLRELAEAVQMLRAAPFSQAPNDGATRGESARPTRLGPYRVVRSIGRGGMGEVYEALEESLGRRVAVKTIRRSHTTSPSLLLRFDRERRTLAKLHHTNIVPIFATGCEEDLLYFAMPYLSGASLGQVIKTARSHESPGAGLSSSSFEDLLKEAHSRSQSASEAPIVAGPAEPSVVTPGNAPPAAPESPAGPSPASPAQGPSAHLLSKAYVRTAVQVMAVVAEGLHHAHEAGVIHRDLKPTNIMVELDGHAWVLDFGLAALKTTTVGGVVAPLAFPIAVPAPESDASLTYGPLGTLPYMAPEQHRDAKQADARSDVWGLGATLYELLTLQRAFPRGESVLNAEPVPPRQLNAGLDRDLEAVVLKALRKDPAHRYPTARALADDLNHWLRREPVSARPAAAPRRLWLWARRNKGWAAALLVTVAALTSAGVIWGKTEAAAARAEAAAAEERERAQIREAYLQQIERIRLTPHVDGWSHEVLDLSHKTFLIDKDNVGFLQSQAATTLAGLDAHKVKSFPFTASALAFDAAGKLLMATPEGKIRVWDATTVQTEDLASPGDGVFAFRPNGTPLQLVIAKDRRSLVLWDVAASRALRTIPTPVEGRSTIVDYALTSDGARVGACIRTLDDHDKHRDEGTVAVWDGGSGRLLKTFPLHRLTKVALSSGGKLLAAGDEDGRITICDVAGEEPIGSFRTGRVPIRCLTFSPGSYRQLRIGGKSPGRASDLLAVGDVAGGLSIWDTYNRIPISYCRGSYYEVIAVAFSPDGSTLASCGRSTPKLWDLATGRRLLDLEGASYLLAIAFAPDGRSLAVSKDSAFGGKAQVDVWKIEDGRGIQTLRGLSFPAEKVVFSPDGKRVAALSHSWQVGVWEQDKGRLLRLMDVPPGSFTDSAGMAFSPDNRRFAFAAGHEATLWDLETNAVLGSWTLPEGLGDWLVFRGSHKLMLVRCENKDGVGGPFSDFPWWKYPRASVIRDLLGSDPSRRLAVLTDINIYVNCSDVSPDGTYYVVEGLSGTPEKKVRSIHLYEVATGKRVWTIPSQQPADDLAGGVGFDPTGTVLAVRLSRGRPVTLLNVPSGDVLDTISPGSPVLGPRAEKQLWLDVLPATPERPEGLSLFQRAVKEPLVTFLLDGNGSSFVRFTRDGLHAAWGRTDGTVTVANFVDVQRRLAEFHMGW